MKKYDVYGVGNALVDIEFRVSEQALDNLKLTKGIMTLIDHDTHFELIDHLQHYDHSQICGGSAANTIVTSQLLGSNNYFACKVANDKAGDFFHTELKNKGINSNISFDTPHEFGSTGKCIAIITPDAERTMCTHLGVSNQLSYGEVDPEPLADSQYLYIEGYLASTPETLDMAIKLKKDALQYGAKTALTLSDPNMVAHHKPALKSIMGDGVDLLFCNKHEAFMFSETENINEACEILKDYAKSFVVTVGKHGAIYYDGANQVFVEATDTKAIDTLGAGDTFAGAFLYAITQGKDYHQATQAANIAAARIITRRGPRLNQLETNELLTELHETVF